MAFIVEALSSHLQPERQVRRVGKYETIAEAITAAQQTIDHFLQREYKPGMDAFTLFSKYESEGEFPFVFRDDDKTLNIPGFNHIIYARTRASEIC